MCDCYKIGGPWIAEDPNCPVHGIEAQRRSAALDDLQEQAQSAVGVEDMRRIICEMIGLMR